MRLDHRGKYIHLTREEWDLAQFPDPPATKLRDKAPDALITTVGLGTGEDRVRETLARMLRTADAYALHHQALREGGGPQEEIDDASRSIFALDSLMARFIRMAGFEPEDFFGSSELDQEAAGFGGNGGAVGVFAENGTDFSGESR